MMWCICRWGAFECVGVGNCCVKVGNCCVKVGNCCVKEVETVKGDKGGLRHLAVVTTTFSSTVIIYLRKVNSALDPRV